MPVNVECPCGHSIRIPTEMAHSRVKCPVCGELLVVPQGTADTDPNDARDDRKVENSEAVSSPEAPETYSMDEPPPVHINEVTHLEGFGGFLYSGLPFPSFFTRSSLTLLPERVRVKSSGLLTTRRVDLRLAAITSGETRRCPGWYLLLPGVLLLAANGAGLVFLLALFFVKHSYVILRCDHCAIAVRIKGDDSEAYAVLDAILQAAQRASRKRVGNDSPDRSVD